MGAVGVSSRASPLGDAVDGGRGGEHEVLHAGVAAGFQQVAGGAGVVAVVLERVGDRLRHDGVGGEVHHRVDVVGLQGLGHQVPVGHVALHEGAMQHRLPKAGGEVVQHHHPLAGLRQHERHVAANITGAAGDQDPFV